jgi:hypothetical protein
LTTTGSSTLQIPNTSSLQSCSGENCACGLAQEAEVSSAQKTRTFNITGAIIITEDVCFTEYGQAEE